MISDYRFAVEHHQVGRARRARRHSTPTSGSAAATAWPPYQKSRDWKPTPPLFPSIGKNKASVFQASEKIRQIFPGLGKFSASFSKPWKILCKISCFAENTGV
jgi:hypothetical protein